MSKASRQRRKRAKVRKARIEAQRQSQQGSTRLKGLKRLALTAWHGVFLAWKIIVVLLLLLGAVSQIYFFIWRLTVTPGQTLKESDPFATMFILENTGEFSIYDVQFDCVAHNIEYAEGVSITDSLFSTRQFDVLELHSHDKTSSPCYLGAMKFRQPVLKADVLLTVSYRPSFSPFHTWKQFHYLAVRRDDGTYLWTETAR